MRSRVRTIIALLAIGCASVNSAEPEVDSSQLPRIPPTPPDKALSTFKVKPGFRIELVAAEPLVVSPVAMSFDEDGRLYVIEMRDYSERRPERLGRVRLLEDTDGDGRMDKSTVFADGLPWPTAVTCWAGGVFVGATPDILWMKDTTGDGVADEREVIFTGFASDYAPFATNKLNVQALMNSFQWTLDNRIHGATSFSGGKVKLVDSEFTRAWRQRGRARSPSPPPREERAGERRADEGESRTLSPTLSPLRRGEGERPETQNPEPGTLDLRGRDFSFDPRTLEMRAESGGGQHGMTFDNRGRKFVCSNSDHIQQIVYEDRYATRNPYYTMPSPRVSIAADGPAAEVFRISPDEPWRVLRTQWRVAGKVPGPIEGGGRASGYFTGATGVTIYRGAAYGEDFVGDAFIGDAGGNLVHRKKLRPDGILMRAERPADERNVEFLASTDNWFRPVQFANAPDGCLYIADMYREVIEHPWSLPPNLKKHLDLNSGHDRGRVYRIVPQDFKQRPPPRMSKANTAEIVELLQHPNGWHWDTAARLLCERQDRLALPSLTSVLSTNALTNSMDRRHSPQLGSQMRIRSLYVLNSMNALRSSDLVDALRWRDADLRENALKLAEPFLTDPSNALWEQLLALTALTKPEDRPVNLQLAFTLGHLAHPWRLDLTRRFLSAELSSDVPLQTNANSITRLFVPSIEAARDRELQWILPAVLSSSEHHLPTLFDRLAHHQLGSVFMMTSSARQSLALAQIARFIGARNRSNEVAQTLDIIDRLQDNDGASGGVRTLPTLDNMETWTVIVALDEGLRQAGSSLRSQDASKKLEPALRRAASFASQPYGRSQADRLLAIRALSAGRYEWVKSILLALVASSSEAPEISRTALTVLAGQHDANFGPDLFLRWRQLIPSVRDEAANVLLKRPERIRALLDAIEKGTVRPAELSVAHQVQLRSHRDAAIRERAEKLFGRPTTAARQSLVESFQPALGLKGDLANGRTIFQTRCASCHKLGDEGHALGPDLATMKSGGKEKLLIAILDPNREVAPNFASYSVETKDGESLTGILASEGANSVTLRMAGGAESVVARANIASMQSQGRSLMPEGLEEGLKPQDMADLLEFITSASR